MGFGHFGKIVSDVSDSCWFRFNGNTCVFVFKRRHQKTVKTQVRGENVKVAKCPFCEKEQTVKSYELEYICCNCGRRIVECNESPYIGGKRLTKKG